VSRNNSPQTTRPKPRSSIKKIPADTANANPLFAPFPEKNALKHRIISAHFARFSLLRSAHFPSFFFSCSNTEKTTKKKNLNRFKIKQKAVKKKPLKRTEKRYKIRERNTDLWTAPDAPRGAEAPTLVPDCGLRAMPAKVSTKRKSQTKKK
jgi:hypothetical protein